MIYIILIVVLSVQFYSVLTILMSISVLRHGVSPERNTVWKKIIAFHWRMSKACDVSGFLQKQGDRFIACFNILTSLFVVLLSIFVFLAAWASTSTS